MISILLFRLFPKVKQKLVDSLVSGLKIGLFVVLLTILLSIVSILLSFVLHTGAVFGLNSSLSSLLTAGIMIMLGGGLLLIIQSGWTSELLFALTPWYTA